MRVDEQKCQQTTSRQTLYQHDARAVAATVVYIQPVCRRIDCEMNDCGRAVDWTQLLLQQASNIYLAALSSCVQPQSAMLGFVHLRAVTSSFTRPCCTTLHTAINEQLTLIGYASHIVPEVWLALVSDFHEIWHSCVTPPHMW